MADRLFALLALLLAALLPGHCHDSLLPGECSQAPSTDELKTFCYDEVEACDEDPRCRALMDSPEDVEPFPPPPESFQAVMDCFARTDDLKQAGWKPSRKKATPPPPPPPPPTRKKQPHIPAKSAVRQAFMDLQCDACLLAVEDLWTLLLHQVDPADGEEPMNMEYSLMDKVHKLCGDPYNRDGARGNVARWVGLHNIYNCTKDETGAAADEVECRAKRKRTGYHIEREDPVDDVVAQHVDAVMTRAKDPDRSWHVGIYSLLCMKHLAPGLPEIAAAFDADGGMPLAKWRDANKHTSARRAQERVSERACERACVDKSRSKRQSKKKKDKAGRGKTT